MLQRKVKLSWRYLLSTTWESLHHASLRKLLPDEEDAHHVALSTGMRTEG